MVDDHGRVIADPLAVEEQPMDEFDLLFSIQASPCVTKAVLESTDLFEVLAPEGHAGAHDSTCGRERILQPTRLVFLDEGQTPQQVGAARAAARHVTPPRT